MPRANWQAGDRTFGFAGTSGNYSTVALPGYDGTYVWGVSDNGTLAGYAYNNSQNTTTMFTKDASGFHTFDYPGPHAQQYLWDANDAGDAVGNNSCCGQGVAFIKQGSTFTTISIPNVAVLPYGINNNDVVAGTVVSNSSPEQGFLWDQGLVTFVNVHGALSTELFDVNDSGEIFGNYHDSNGYHLFLGIPNEESASVPEPCTLVLLGSGLFASARIARHKRAAQ